MNNNKIIEYTFFFALFAVVSYLVWQIFAPFVSALALSAIIVTICYPLFERIIAYTPRHNRTLAALSTTLAVLAILILPFVFITSSLVREAVSVYHLAETGSSGNIELFANEFQSKVQLIIPDFQLNITGLLKQSAIWLSTNLGAIFAGTASTIFLFLISLIGSFYFFRDGKDFIKWLVLISPLMDNDDEKILKRTAKAIRAVATGTILVALIQGTLTAIGLSIFGFDRAILWGAIAFFGALIPSVGTTIVFVPAIIYSVLQGNFFIAIGISVWAVLAVGLIDNILGPYLMSRGNNLHPFIILISVLGGISLFGPIGFIVGPVVVTLFKVLLEIYGTYFAHHINNKK